MKKLLYLGLALLGLTFATSCEKTQNDPVPEPPVNEDLLISSSDRYLAADGTSEVKFTVMLKGQDVTASARVYQYLPSGSKALASPSFKTTEAGTYTFYAIADGVFSERINVVGATAFPEMPLDPLPTKFDSFRKRVIAHQSTGLWCGWCPLVMNIIRDFGLMDSKADDVVFVSAHYGDKLTSDQSHEFNLAYNAKGAYPIMTMSMSKNPSNLIQSNGTYQKVRSVANATLAVDAASAIAASSKMVGGKICVMAEVKIAKQGNYRVGAYLLEDGIYATQTNSSSIKEDWINMHENILRAGAPKTGLHEAVGGLKQVEANSKHKFYCEFDIAKSDIADVKNAHLVVFVYDAKGEICDNVISLKVDAQQPYVYL